MNYATAKAKRDAVEMAERAAAKVFKSIPGSGSGPMGLTPEHIRLSPEYRAAKEAWAKAFKALQDHNRRFVKTYKREIQEERKARFEP